MERMIITVTRQFGSRGQAIGRAVAEHFDIPFYGKDAIDALALARTGMKKNKIEETIAARNLSMGMRNFMAVLGVGGRIDNLSMNTKEFRTHAAAIRELASRGSCVICGRCADFVLKDDPDVTSVFIYAEQEERIRCVVEEYGVDPKDARASLLILDKARENYYNYHTGRQWADAANYHMSLDSGYLTMENAVKLIEDYIRIRKY